MIRIAQATDSKTRLWIELKPTLPLTESIWFSHECASEIECNLLEQHLRKQLTGRIELIRKLSYNRGWRDKTSKKPKSAAFYCGTDIMDWEREEGRD